MLVHYSLFELETKICTATSEREEEEEAKQPTLPRPPRATAAAAAAAAVATHSLATFCGLTTTCAPRGCGGGGCFGQVRRRWPMPMYSTIWLAAPGSQVHYPATLAHGTGLII